MGKAKMFVMFGPPNMTHKYQPIDHGPGKVCKDKIKKRLRAWRLASKRNARLWNEGRMKAAR